MDIRDASDYTLVAELERRGFFSKLARVVEAHPDLPKQPLVGIPALPGHTGTETYTVPPKPPLGRFIPGTDRPMPKDARSVVEIPDRTNKDGSQLRLITVAGAGADPATKPQFIVKGDERERLAQGFIDQWQEEIAALEARLGAEVLPQEEIDTLWSEINRLQENIRLRSTSAFGSMGIEEVKARNIALNGVESVMDAPSLPGDPSKGVQFHPVLHLPEFDNPSRCHIPLNGQDGEVLKAVETLITWDPFVLHLPRPVFQVTADRNLVILMEPVVIWRTLVHLDLQCTRQRTDLRSSATAQALAAAWNNEAAPGRPVINLEMALAAEAFKRGWTAFLQAMLRHSDGEHHYKSLKRTIRIFNVDFQEKEAPDFMFEEGTDGENPLGVQHRGHVNPRAAWTEVQEGPGVFRMKRHDPLDHSDLEEAGD